jgi:hypothetical protein
MPFLRRVYESWRSRRFQKPELNPGVFSIPSPRRLMERTFHAFSIITIRCFDVETGFFEVESDILCNRFFYIYA